ncbi:hypothetical protein, partial [Clostridium sp. D5]|uniref:hypothetical protein n=1 Tax=Clostridium sp. D5 TaxID=556261 RepID=UPI001A997C40
VEEERLIRAEIKERNNRRLSGIYTSQQVEFSLVPFKNTSKVRFLNMPRKPFLSRQLCYFSS